MLVAFLILPVLATVAAIPVSPSLSCVQLARTVKKKGRRIFIRDVVGYEVFSIFVNADDLDSLQGIYR